MPLTKKSLESTTKNHAYRTSSLLYAILFVHTFERSQYRVERLDSLIQPVVCTTRLSDISYRSGWSGFNCSVRMRINYWSRPLSIAACSAYVVASETCCVGICQELLVLLWRQLLYQLASDLSFSITLSSLAKPHPVMPLLARQLMPTSRPCDPAFEIYVYSALVVIQSDH